MNAFTCKSELRTHQGNVRTHNEDSLAARDEDGLWVVADGMGGHHAGDYASQKITSTLKNANLRAYLVDVVEQVEDSLFRLNNELIGYGQEKFNGNKVGSTVACLVIRYGVAVAIWAGDSRIYLLRNNKLYRMSHDHSKVQEMMDVGHLTKEQAEQSRFKNMLTRAVGVHDELFVDINAFTVKPKDRFLICTDGLYNEVNEARIQQLIHQSKIQKSSDRLLSEALSGEARDNVSFILVEVQ
ncbi:PP2C family protein-serine/threonine phosphatase [Hahella ganghwensis]|uniref:PP2C family protein-serine/threonine phosphatase n=1 Tax=Hahella ganghwensis TaxID=286420 RepID=UPI00036A1A68|nr:protein phosphatase 2C domain-containing protein [Hahella ganghwensis]